ncbi:MAG: hypothetical protein QOH73_714 [Gaiellaceae bacterium]|nr:hypothetical protein [Gaiellaceae bacterium]
MPLRSAQNQHMATTEERAQAVPEGRAEPRPPYEAYAAITVTFAGLLAAASALGRLRDREPGAHSWLDLTALTLATFKASRTIARDEVTSFVRAPFVEGDAHEGGEHPVETGDFHQAIGELVTCSRCIGTWVAAALGTAQLLTPRFGRLLTWTLCAAGANDFAQAAFTALTAKANTMEGGR